MPQPTTTDTAAQPTSSEPPLETDTVYYLPVMETSDIHGYIADNSGIMPLYVLSYISDKAKDIRGYGENYRKEKLLLLDAGDIYQGNTLSNLLNGDSLSAAYQMMGYDVVTIGNHEFDWGIENMIDSDKTMKDFEVDQIKGVNSIKSSFH